MQKDKEKEPNEKDKRTLVGTPKVTSHW